MLLGRFPENQELVQAATECETANSHSVQALYSLHF